MPTRSVPRMSTLLGACAAFALSACSDATPAAPDSPQVVAPDFPLGVIQPVDNSISTTDTWVTYDATREQATYVTTTQPVLDAATLQPASSMTIAAPTQTLHTEGGYDSYGTLRVNEYRQPAADDPYAGPVDETTRVQVVGDQVTGYAADGEVTVAAEVSDVSSAPLSELGSLAGAQVTAGVIVSRQEFESVAIYNRGGAQFNFMGSPSRVERVAPGRVRVTTFVSSQPEGGEARLNAGGRPDDTKVTRGYQLKEDKYVLESVEVESSADHPGGQMRVRQTTRLRNVKWHENKEKDDQRKIRREKVKAMEAARGGGASAVIGPEENVCMTTRSGFGPSYFCGGGGGGYTEPPPPPPPPPSSNPCAAAEANGKNVVFQHGILSDSTTWSRMYPWISVDFYLGCRLRPSLPSRSRLGIQADSLTKLIQGTGQGGYVLIGHSQGGLISRRVAQQQPGLVSGVVTIGTPHQGAPIAGSATTAVTAGLIGVAALASYGCGGGISFACSRTVLIATAVVPVLGKFAYDASTDVFTDLKPGSAFTSNLNANYEPFRRAGIQSYPKKLWVEWRLYGDMRDYPDGPDGGRREVKRANGAFLTNTACGVVGWLVGFGSTAAKCATRAAGMLAVSGLWNYMTARLHSTDGIVPGYSQIYPNALQNYDIPKGDSHVGETKSDKTRDRLRLALRDRMLVTKKPSW